MYANVAFAIVLTLIVGGSTLRSSTSRDGLEFCLSIAVPTSSWCGELPVSVRSLKASASVKAVHGCVGRSASGLCCLPNVCPPGLSTEQHICSPSNTIPAYLRSHLSMLETFDPRGIFTRCNNVSSNMGSSAALPLATIWNSDSTWRLFSIQHNVYYRL